MSDEFAKEIDLLIRARYTLLYVVSWEEERMRRILAKISEKQQKSLFEWSVTDGLRNVYSPFKSDMPESKGARQRDALAALNEILQADAPAIYLLKDFHTYLEAPEIVRQLRDLGNALRQSHKTIVILSPELKIPTPLEKSITVLDLPLPDYQELSSLLKQRIASPTNSRQFKINLRDEERDALVKAAQGLTFAEARNAFAKAIVRDRVLDGDDVQAVVDEKVQAIRKSGLLEYVAVNDTIDGVGGMDILKDWLDRRARAFSTEAREYGLPQPRGMLLLGVQGCGKSLVAKATASAWNIPLLRMDMSRIFQGYIGSSEENMRRALKIAESLAPVILWVDEIEKAFSGMDGSSASDGGTTARVIGQFLTWMQEKERPVFVVATANEIKGLPPELLRKGRLDEIFFVDLPRSRERAEIFQIHLRKLGRDPANLDLHSIVPETEGFSGAEIEQALISALHDSFFANRELETNDLLKAVRETVPLSQTVRERITEFRAWAADRARPVSSKQNRNLADDA